MDYEAQLLFVQKYVFVKTLILLDITIFNWPIILVCPSRLPHNAMDYFQDWKETICFIQSFQNWIMICEIVSFIEKALWVKVSFNFLIWYLVHVSHLLKVFKLQFITVCKSLALSFSVQSIFWMRKRNKLEVRQNWTLQRV